MDDLPEFVTRKAAAEWITRHLFPISPRTLERWPVATRRVNGRALMRATEVIAYARKAAESARPIAGG